MKTQSTILFKAMTTLQMASLTAEVKETIAREVNPATHRTFSAGDLWAIQRKVKSASTRRQLA